MAESRGWTVVEVYIDRDTSVWRSGVVRPEYDRLKVDAEARAFDTVLSWKLDRLGRSAAELTRIIDDFAEYGVDLACVEDPVDTTTPTGKLVTQIIAAIAEMESTTISLRAKAKHRADAEKGRYVKGGTRSFGRRHDGSVVPREAEVLRDMAAALIEGETSLHGIAVWLNDHGFTTTTGRPWLGPAVGQLLRHPHLRVCVSTTARSSPGTSSRSWTRSRPFEFWSDLKLGDRAAGPAECTCARVS